MTEAQVTTPAVSRALFGSDRNDPNRPEKADFSLSFNVTNDNGNKLAAGLQRDVLDSRMPRSGLYSALEGILSYRRKTKRMVFGADTTSTLQYYPRFNDTVGDHGARVTVKVPFRRRTELSASQRLMYFQSYHLPVFPTLPRGASGSVPISNTGEAVSRLEAYSATTNLRLTQSLSSRSSVDFDYDFQSVDFSRGEPDLRTWGAAGHFTRRLSRSAGLRLGYGQRRGRYGGSVAVQTIRIHDLDLGVDYSRSLSRSMTVSVTPGSSIVVGSDGRQYRLSGEITVNRRLDRSWAARMVYRRSSQFVEGFGQPVFLDSAIADLGGYLGRRFELSSSCGYSRGEIGSSRQATYDSYSGSARASFAMSRHYAVSFEYLYYNHRFAGDITIPAAAALDRHSMRIGLRWWRPLR